MSTTTIPPYHGSYLMPRLKHATVSDAMHPGVLSCGADATLTDVARLMSTHHVHSAAVIGISHDYTGEKLVWGIVSTWTSCGPRSGPQPIGSKRS